MPELPEVETMRRGIRPIIGHRIAAVERPPCRLRPIVLEPRIDSLARRMHDRTIIDVGRRGKRILLELEDRQWLVIEPRMTGLVLLADPPGPEHLRLRLRLRGGAIPEMLFWDRRGLGTVRLLSAGEFATRLGPDRLGPDALEVSAESLRQRLAGSQRAIKVALLDQRAVAGIGNLYAAEILHVAGIDPRARCDKLSRPQWQRIAQATRFVLEEAIRYEGSTLADGTYRNALNDPGSYQSLHRVYARAETTCRRCESAQIRRIVQAQRATFFCPNCQRRAGLHPCVTGLTEG
jgi:formamidopyrimidine-DNA glycosylase